MNILKKATGFILAAALAATLAACGAGASSTQSQSVAASGAGQAQSSTAGAQGQSIVVKVGVVGENNEQWQPVVDALEQEGITLELVKFADYTLPNQALADGEIDLNAFQHKAFLANEVKDKNLDLISIADTVIAPLGVYSDKIKTVDELKDGDKIAIPNDATNGGRALRLLESAGIITVAAEAGFVPELKDITANPKNIEFIEVEAAQTSSLLPDVAAAVINGGHAVDHGFIPGKDSIYLEDVTGGSENPYVNIIVARTADKDNEVYAKVVKAYQSDAVEEALEAAYGGAYIPAWK